MNSVLLRCGHPSINAIPVSHEKHGHLVFAKCSTGTSDSFLFMQGGELVLVPAHKEGQALPYPSLAPTAASVGGRGKPQLPLEKKKKLWKLPKLKLCFLSLATNYSCTAKSHTHHYRDLVFHEGKRAFSNATSEQPLDGILTVFVLFIKMVTIKRIRILLSSFSLIFNSKLTSKNLLCDVIVLPQQPAVTLHDMWVSGYS